MTDFFDRLERELTEAAARDAQPTPDGTPARAHRAGRRRRLVSRPLLLAMLGLVVAGTATAGIVTLTGAQPSKPLDGTYTSPAKPGQPPTAPAMADFCEKNAGACPGSQPSATDYQVGLLPFAVVPNPSQSHYEHITGAGRVGWCATARTAAAHSAGRIYGCSPAVSSKQSARIAGGSLGVGAQRVTFVVVDERVAGVRLRDGRIIEPRSDTSLPGDWRAAIWSGGTDTPTTVDLLNAHGQQLPANG